MAARQCFTADELDVLEDDFQAVVDSSEESNQLAGNAHTFEVWADDEITGTNLLIAEVVSNVVSLYSSAGVAKNLGKSGTPWTMLYATDATLGSHTATRVFFAGTGGLVSTDAGMTFTAATDTFSIGVVGAAAEIRFANQSFTRIASHGYNAGTFGGGYNFDLNNGVPRHDSTGQMSGYWFNVGAISLYTNSSQAAATSATRRMNIANTGAVTIDQWSNTGTTTLATAQGDGAWGLTGGFQCWFDQSSGQFNIYGSAGMRRGMFNASDASPEFSFFDSGGAIQVQWYSAGGSMYLARAGTANRYQFDVLTGGRVVIFDGAGAQSIILRGITGNTTTFNALNTDIDFVINADVNSNAFFVDAGAAAGAGQIRMNVSGVTFGADAAPTNSATVDIQGSLGVGAHGTTLANADACFGSSTTNKAFWDDNIFTWFVKGCSNIGTATDAAGSGDFASGLTGAGRMVFDQAVNGFPRWILYDNDGAIAVAFHPMNGVITPPAGAGWIFNEQAQEDNDLRVEGGSLTHALFFDASTASENLHLLTTAAANTQSMDRGIFIGDSTTAPTGNPTAGGFLYVVAGALVWRSPSGAVTELAPA